MTQRSPEEKRREAAGQASPDRGPGAHSGAERQPRDRAVPGTASNREGYTTEGGTAHGEQLAGVEADEETARPRPDRSAGQGREDTRRTPDRDRADGEA
ncbi:hypothetical protein [Streptomyces pactum]|uniref:hypothetical protein n=1 Tax=Streptomyces pactum TaxID=68249 RepID=UPI0036F95D92